MILFENTFEIVLFMTKKCGDMMFCDLNEIFYFG